MIGGTPRAAGSQTTQEVGAVDSTPDLIPRRSRSRSARPIRREALRDPVMAVVNAVQACLGQSPPELAADIVDKGIVLTGGGALPRGLDRLLHEQTDLSITVSDDALLLE